MTVVPRRRVMAVRMSVRTVDWLLGAWRSRSWRGLGYLLLGLPAGALALAASVLAVAGGAVLSVTVVGVLIVPMLLGLVRATAGLERRRCAIMRPAPLPPYQRLDGLTGRALLKARLSDPATWRDLAWLLLAVPIAVFCAALAVTLWTAGAGLLSIPVWYRFLPGGQAKLYESGGVAQGAIASAPAALPWALLGLALLWAAGWATQALALGQSRLAAALLGPTRTSGLRTRVATLSATRAAAVEVQQGELHRIERDLHDGAQARLVALSADLGLAGEAFDENPGQARQLVEQARDGVVLALAELRDLVRGIGPPVLIDRGLPAAVESVAARSPIPVTLIVDLPRRPSAAVEAAAYFVICEALANTAKHSRARQVSVDLHRQDGGCVVRVVDDGGGGADPHGDGLRGLADRVAALDGYLTVDSPPEAPPSSRRRCHAGGDRRGPRTARRRPVPAAGRAPPPRGRHRRHRPRPGSRRGRPPPRHRRRRHPPATHVHRRRATRRRRGPPPCATSDPHPVAVRRSRLRPRTAHHRWRHRLPAQGPHQPTPRIR
jgi:signal transduction histidine kinase